MNKNENPKSNENIESKEEFIEKDKPATPKEFTIDPKTQKYILLTPITPEFKSKLTHSIQALLQLRQDILAKKDLLTNKRHQIKEKITSLSETKKVRLDKNEFEKTEKSANDFIKLLDSIINELNNEIGYYYIFASDEKPPFEKIVAPINAPDKLEDYLAAQINGIKQYLKNVKRDISVSFSRYSFGCDEQIKHLSFVESYIKSQEIIKSQKDKSTQK